MKVKTSDEIITRITKALGLSKSELADMFNVSKAAVNYWRFNGIPSQHCTTLEGMLKNTNDPMTCIDMRPRDWQKWWPMKAQEIAGQKLKRSNHKRLVNIGGKHG